MSIERCQIRCWVVFFFCFLIFSFGSLEHHFADRRIIFKKIKKKKKIVKNIFLKKNFNFERSSGN